MASFYIPIPPPVRTDEFTDTITLIIRDQSYLMDQSFDVNFHFVGVPLTFVGESLPVYQLTITNGGNGSVSSNPAGINCGTTCTASFTQGTVVTLTAAPSAGFAMTWGGACAGAGSCTVTMDTARSVTATFADTQAPSAPPGLAATPMSTSQINLSWTPSTDNVGVTQYKVYRGGALIAVLGSVNVYGDGGLATGTAYSYTLQACDAAGNCSVPSGAISATTLPATVATTSTTTTTTQAAVTTTTTSAATTTTSAATTTTSAATTTTVATTTTTTQPATATLTFAQGWNLTGNSSDTPINVTTTFADSNRFATVWKWIADQSVWSLYAPSLAVQGASVLSDYVASKGYQMLSTIAGGEGFWVNARQSGSVTVARGNAVSVSSLGPRLVRGWNLVSVGETITPKQFCEAQEGGVNTLWAWDAASVAWYFYASSLDAGGGLVNYAASHGYLDFTASGKSLGNGTGFWVNRP